MAWTNWETKTFNMHHRGMVLERLVNEFTATEVNEDDVTQIIQSIIDLTIDDVKELGDIFISDLFEEGLENINVRELADTYYYEFKNNTF